jgi:hypothetical protein
MAERNALGDLGLAKGEARPRIGTGPRVTQRIRESP